MLSTYAQDLINPTVCYFEQAKDKQRTMSATTKYMSHCVLAFKHRPCKTLKVSCRVLVGVQQGAHLGGGGWWGAGGRGHIYH